MHVIIRELRDHPNASIPKYTVVSPAFFLVIGVEWPIEISVQSKFCIHVSKGHPVVNHLPTNCTPVTTVPEVE